MSVWLFPGQGAQFVGMCSRLVDVPGVLDLFKLTSFIFGRDLLQLCLRGPKEDLDRTVNCQPAVLLASLAALKKIEQEKQRTWEMERKEVKAVAGFSVGEITALIAAESMSLHEGCHLVKLRSEAMQKASDASPGGMISVIGLGDTQLSDICSQCPTGNLQVSNYLFPMGKVLSGSAASLTWLKDQLPLYKPRRVKQLAVSGAFHSPLMLSAQEEVKKALDRMDIRMPRFPVYSNVSGRHYASTGEIKNLLARQICEPVQWEQTMIGMLNQSNVRSIYEIGPGSQLKTMLKRTNIKAWEKCEHIEA